MRSYVAHAGLEFSMSPVMTLDTYDFLASTLHLSASQVSSIIPCLAFKTATPVRTVVQGTSQGSEWELSS